MARPAKPNAADILATLKIASRAPEALRHAESWARLLTYVAKGTDDRTACSFARVSARSLRDWKAWGAKGKAPYDEFLAAYEEQRARVVGDVWASLFSAAKDGDVRAAEIILRRTEAKNKAQLEAAIGKTRHEIMRVQLEQEQLKLQRMREGGPDSTVGNFHNVVLLPALATGPGKARLVGPIDGTAAPIPTPAPPPALDAPADREEPVDPARGVDPEPRPADGFPWLQR